MALLAGIYSPVLQLPGRWITPLDLSPPGLSVGVPSEKNGDLSLLRIGGRKEIFSTGFLDLSNSLILIN